MNSASITLVTGGARSGKSRYALELAVGYEKRAFIATAEPFDEEMAVRIAHHKRERMESFLTIEAPLDLAGALRAIPSNIEVAVVDCLTVWLGNLMHHYGIKPKRYAEISAFVSILEESPCHLIVVTNEVGLGLVPDNDVARHYRDMIGELNQEICRMATQAIFMISGMPLIVIKKDR